MGPEKTPMTQIQFQALFSLRQYLSNEEQVMWHGWWRRQEWNGKRFLRGSGVDGYPDDPIYVSEAEKCLNFLYIVTGDENGNYAQLLQVFRPVAK